MATQLPTPRVLVGPRRLDDRICRIMYVRETDEVWTEEWCEQSWVRATVLVRHLIKAPLAKHSVLKRHGIATELGEWDQEQIRA